MIDTLSVVLDSGVDFTMSKDAITSVPVLAVILLALIVIPSIPGLYLLFTDGPHAIVVSSFGLAGTITAALSLLTLVNNPYPSVSPDMAEYSKVENVEDVLDEEFSSASEVKEMEYDKDTGNYMGEYMIAPHHDDEIDYGGYRVTVNLDGEVRLDHISEGEVIEISEGEMTRIEITDDNGGSGEPKFYEVSSNPDGTIAFEKIEDSGDDESDSEEDSGDNQ